TYPASHQINGPPSDLTVGDVNSDGNLDVVVLDGNGWSVPGRGDGTFVEPDPWYLYEFYTTGGARKVELGDYTGDGKFDAIFAGDVIAVHRGDGDGFFDGPINHSANGYEHTGVAAADFDGDGLLDAVTSDADTGTVSELLGNGDGKLTYAGAYAVG